MKALQEAGLPIDQTIIKLGNATSSWGFIAASDLINRPSPPTAIYVASNAIIPGVLRSVRQKGLKLPEDLSLICFDDVNWFSFSVPPITSVRVGHKVLAEVALNILFRRIENSDLDEQVKEFVEIPFDLVLRLSTAPPSLRP
jgi:LacI family transcriptional regulator